ncbi:unannotated protein [freshwater metagenome]|uniref:Unannotated protein n=1 Tax=freshwater metagenome TaxID=449393 RepID=A0A6J7E5C9_9ZZZZ
MLRRREKLLPPILGAAEDARPGAWRCGDGCGHFVSVYSLILFVKASTLAAPGIGAAAGPAYTGAR